MLQNHIEEPGCYPGDEIPKLFSYRSLGNLLLNIKLPLDWNSNDLLGAVFCVVVHPIKIVDRYHHCSIRGQIHDEHAHEYDCSVDHHSLKINSDHIIMWYKDLKRPSWCNTCSNLTEISFHAMIGFSDDRGDRVYDLGRSIWKIKKCGFGLVYNKDLEQFATSDDNEYSEASRNGVVRSQDDEENDRDDESHPTSNSNKIFTLVCCLISRLKISKNKSNWFYFQFTMLHYKVF